jgi:hypothetical protein
VTSKETYCGKWFDDKEMTALYEKGNQHINYYCDGCLPEVKSNVRGLPWYSEESYRFGFKGEQKD